MAVIAILGAGGYVGRSLARAYAERGTDELVLFTRDPERLASRLGLPGRVAIRDTTSFAPRGFEIIVNAVGAGDPAAIRALGPSLLRLTETWDNRVLDGLEDGNAATYVYCSSGAVYGDFAVPATPDRRISLPINPDRPHNPYFLSKFYAEAKHRSLAHLRICDIRIFGFADPSLDRDGTSFLADLARALRQGTPLVTTSIDFVRDYAGARELMDLIDACHRQPGLNAGLNLHTAAPVSKRELLATLSEEFGLTHAIVDPGTLAPVERLQYFSRDRRAAAIGYAPRRTSLQVIRDVLSDQARQP